MRRIHTTEDQAGIYKSQVISTEAEMVRGFSLQPHTPPVSSRAVALEEGHLLLR